MRPTNHANIFGVDVAGVNESLRVDLSIHQCDHIQDGIGFTFGEKKGWFVIPLSELREIVETADMFRP